MNSNPLRRGRLLGAILTAMLLLTAGNVARADHRPSAACDNGNGNEIPVVSSPITLGVQYDVVGPHYQVNVCYSTTPVDTPGGVTGGVLVVWADASTGDATVLTGAYCIPDPDVNVGPSCDTEENGVSLGTVNTDNGASVQGLCVYVLGDALTSDCESKPSGITYAPGDLPDSSLPPGTTCTVFVETCLFTAPAGLKLWVGYDTANDTIDVKILGIDADSGLIDIPKTCVGTPGMVCP